MRRPLSVLVLACGLLLAPAAARAQTEDPTDGSPSGTIYEIPLDDGRSDAAPRPRSGGDEPPASPIRSQNGFGSSSTVPGTAATPAAGGVTPTASQEAALAPSPEPSRSGGRREAAGEGSSRAELDANDEPRVPAGGVIRQGAEDPSPVLGRSGLLLGLAFLVAAGLAAGGRLLTRRR